LRAEEPALSLSKGSMQSFGATGAASECMDPSARKERGPQDDRLDNKRGRDVRI